MDVMKGALGMNEQTNQTWQEEFDQACCKDPAGPTALLCRRALSLTCPLLVACGWAALDRTTRLIGFGACFVFGWVVSGLGLLFIGEPSTFAGYYSAGNILGICSTFFLFGPCAQLKRMFDRVRVFATIVYLLAIGLTLFVAIEVGNIFLVLLCMAFQCLAMIWYCASYIPYGRKCLQSCVGSICQV
jgi:hypothetical protein